MSGYALSSSQIVGQAMAYLVLFALPDVIFVRKQLFTSKRRKLLHYAVMLFFTCILLAAAGNHVLVLILVLLLTVLSLSWHLCYAYFGDVLKPELVLLFVKPDHMADAVEAGLKDIRRIAPAAAVVGGCGAVSVLLVLHGRSATDASLFFALAATAWIAATGVRAGLNRKERAVYPTPGMPSVVGSLHAIALAIRWTMHGAQSPALPGAIAYSLGPFDEEPLTVAVIMGESINPKRLSLYGGPAETTPLLHGRAVSSGPSILLPRIGFSAGVASNSSIAGFLTGSPFPYRVAGSRTLFDLAKAQGFSTSYLSAQKRSPLDMAGSLGSIDRVETNESNSAVFRKKRDWLLVDLLERMPAADRSFVFIYQRVNHTPYYNHQVGELERFYAPPRNQEEILHNYDVGLRTYDRNTNDLLNTLQKRPGALYVIVTADHGELLGEDGLYGHNKSGSLHCASVPVMLFTNRPHAAVAREFAGCERLDAFTVSRLLMKTMGVGIEVDGYDPETFYVSNALPFGRSGYMGVRCVNPEEYSVVLNDRNGHAERRELVRLAIPAGGSLRQSASGSKLVDLPNASLVE